MFATIIIACTPTASGDLMESADKCATLAGPIVESVEQCRAANDQLGIPFAYEQGLIPIATGCFAIGEKT